MKERQNTRRKKESKRTKTEQSKKDVKKHRRKNERKKGTIMFWKQTYTFEKRRNGRKR